MLAVLFSLLTLTTFVNHSAATPASDTSIWLIRDLGSPPNRASPATADLIPHSSRLKYQVTGIVCAYLAWVALTAVALLVVRKRLRRGQESPDQSVEMQTAKPTGQITLREIEAGPRSPLGPKTPMSLKSPGKMSSIKSWAKGHNKGRTSESSVSTANTRIDERVLEQDKVRNMDDMAKLYAAVMAHDEERGISHSLSNGSSPILDDHTPATPRTPRTPRSPQYPPEMAHPAYVPPMPQEYQEPRFEPMAHPPIPESDESSLLENQTPRKTKNSAMSIISSTTSRLGSSHSNKSRPAPITVRGQPISKPLGSADLRQSAYSGSQASLPVYSPGPPPPTPGRTPAPKIEEIELHGRPQLTQVESEDTISTTTKTLPFRQFYQQDALKSAPATKTTFVDRRQSAFNGPKTGVPKTPYSPYCPTTPMTPVTPRRLPNKQEIKQNKKQYAMQVVKENEMVQSDNDMWGTD